MSQLWRDAAPTPQISRTSASVTMSSVRKRSAWFGWPVLFGEGTASRLEFTAGEDKTVSYVEFTVPRRDYWDMILMKRN